MSGAVVVLSGGIGGAKLLLGLDRILPPGALTAIINTADDFDHLGLRICPDVDTTLYTLAGLADPERGWGRQDETWTFMRALETLGGETWFSLGDGDLALHVERTRRLAGGEPLSAITADLAARLGVGAQLAPMSDDPVRTMVRTAEAEIGFQDYFVRQSCRPRVRALRFAGAERARAADTALRALADPELRAIIIAPSNPYLSVSPILAVPGIREALRARAAPLVAVTPIIAGAAVKGPTVKIMRELGFPPSPLAVARQYQGLLDGFLLDERDAGLQDQFDIPVRTADTLMRSLEDRERVAREALALAAAVDRRPGRA